MSEWKEYKLGDVAEIKYGKAHQTLAEGNIPAYGSGGIMRYVDRAIYDDESILIPRKGTLNNIFYKSEPFWTVDTMFWTKLNKQIVFPKFLFYQLSKVDFSNMNVGSAVPSMTVEVLNDLNIFLPSKIVQKEITEVLSSLDDKIDILNSQNKTLGKLADALFKQWFIEEAEEQSENQISFGDLIESVSITHKSKKEEAIFLNTSDIYLGEVLINTYSSKGTLPGQAKKSISKNDILFSEIRPANGRWAYIDFDADDYVVSTKLMVLRTKNKITQPFIYFYLTHPKTVEWLQMLADSRSGTFPQITFEQLKGLKINIPSESKLREVEEWCSLTLIKIKKNTAQIRSLIQLRDTLLPKLMSGEVKVKN